MKIFFFIVTIISTFFSGNVLAAIEAITTDGQRVLLNENKTWEYADKKVKNAKKEIQAQLMVTHVEKSPKICTIDFKLQNDLPVVLHTIVLWFSAYINEGVQYQSVTQSFEDLRPTDYQYKEIQFRGVDCDQIQYVRVHGGARCVIGELDKFSSTDEQCLAKINVQPSRAIKIVKSSDEPAK